MVAVDRRSDVAEHFNALIGVVDPTADDGGLIGAGVRGTDGVGARADACIADDSALVAVDRRSDVAEHFNAFSGVVDPTADDGGLVGAGVGGTDGVGAWTDAGVADDSAFIAVDRRGDIDIATQAVLGGCSDLAIHLCGLIWADVTASDRRAQVAIGQVVVASYVEAGVFVESEISFSVNIRHRHRINLPIDTDLPGLQESTLIGIGVIGEEIRSIRIIQSPTERNVAELVVEILRIDVQTAYIQGLKLRGCVVCTGRR